MAFFKSALMNTIFSILIFLFISCSIGQVLYAFQETPFWMLFEDITCDDSCPFYPSISNSASYGSTVTVYFDTFGLFISYYF